MQHFLPNKTSLAVVVAVLGIGPWVCAQSAAPPKAMDVAKALGFTEAEIPRVKAGEIVMKDLEEGSDKELAGALVALFKQPVAELADIALEGKMLDTDPNVLAYQSWAPDKSAEEAFAKLALDAQQQDEARLYSRAAPGGKLNLSMAEIERFKKLKPDQVNDELRASLKTRYESYRQNGLQGIAPYVRGGDNTASPANELTLAIKETMTAAQRHAYFDALLSYPANPLTGMQHRFYWSKTKVEGRPTFVLAHRASLRSDKAALLTEEQYYVSHSYNSNFIAGGCLAVEEGTVVFYVNRTFTDQVAGFGSSMKHGIGRKQMLSEVATTLKRVRDQLQK